MRIYTPKMRKEEQVSPPTRCAGLATPDGMLGTIPRYVHYSYERDVFFTCSKRMMEESVYITTIYPKSFEQERSHLQDIEQFHRENNPEIRRST